MIDRCRGSPALLKFFTEEFRGTLVTDFWGAYNKVVCSRRQMCLVHLLRDFLTVEKYKSPGPPLAGVCEADAAVDSRCHAAEQARRPVGRRVRLASVAVGRSVADDDRHAVGRFPGERLIKRLRRHQRDLFTFLDQPDVPSTTTTASGAFAGGYYSQEQLLQPQPQRSSRPSRPDEHLPKPETTRP